LIATFCWSEQTRVKVAIIKDAAQIANTNDLVKDHIHTVVGDLGTPYRTCSTSFIHKLLKIEIPGARVLRVIIFDSPKQLAECLDEEKMVIAFSDCFTCESFLCYLGLALTWW
jgi:hypothetical protein